MGRSDGALATTSVSHTSAINILSFGFWTMNSCDYKFPWFLSHLLALPSLH
jgi:hypothetical protein